MSWDCPNIWQANCSISSEKLPDYGTLKDWAAFEQGKTFYDVSDDRKQRTYAIISWGVAPAALVKPRQFQGEW